MPDTSDARLLEQFVRNSSEEAFTALVQRHIGLVHSVALRHTAHPQHAEDITQAVFIILARKADRLGPGTVLPGWLYHTARLTAANWQRAEARRVRREQEAFMQSQLEETPTDNLWRELSPQLDQAMAGLGTVERDALVLRYFQNKGLAEVGQSLGLSENAAQKRVHQALEKLRRFFSKRGVDVTASHIADSISTHSVQAVPAALVKSVAAVALAKGTVATTSTLTLVKGALKIMAWTKAKTSVAVGIIVVLILAGGTGGVVLSKRHTQHEMVAKAYHRANLTDPRYRDILRDLRANVWPKERQEAEAKIKARQQVDETANAVTIDLRRFVNATLTDSPVSTQGNNEDNLAELPPGINIYGGVPFDVKGIIQLDGTNMVIFNKKFPAEVDGIPINHKCARLYLFHGANWIYTSDFGKTVAKLVLHYDDGTTNEINIVAGKQIFDWWLPLFTTGVDPRYSEMAAGTERAWTGSNPFIKKHWPDESLILFKSTFENPKPDVTVVSVDYVSTVTGTAPFLAGLTVE